MTTQNKTSSKSKTNEELAELFGLNDQAEFIGHVIWVEENSAFVNTISGSIKKPALATFDTRRECALVYATYEEAEIDAARLEKSTKIGFLFDIDNELVVFTEQHIKSGVYDVLSQEAPIQT